MKEDNPNKVKILMLVNGKMTHQPKQGIDIGVQKLESTMLIGFVHWPFNWSFSFTALSTQLMLVDLIQKRARQLNRRKMESSNA